MRRFRKHKTLTTELLEARHLLSSVPLSLTILGDSVSTGLSPADADRIGVPTRDSYRPVLWDLMTSEFPNADFEFVGSSDYNPTDLPPEAVGHSTHRGFATYSFFPFDNNPNIGSEPNGPVNSNDLNADGWASFDVDVAMVLIGTNDVFEGRPPSRIEDVLRDMIDEFRIDNNNVDILVGTLPPLDPARPNADDIPAVNDMIFNLVNPEPEDGWLGSTVDSPIRIVDHYHGESGQPFDLSVHSEDGVHPNTAGDQLMANNWWSVLRPVIADAVAPPVDPPPEDPPAEEPPPEDPPPGRRPRDEDPPAEDPPAEEPPAEEPPAEDPPAEDPPPTKEPPQKAQPVSPQVLAINANSETVREGNRARFVIERTDGDLSQEISVEFKLGGTASQNDYKVDELVTLPAGDRSVTVDFKTIDDRRVERDETITMTLLPTDAYSVGLADAATTTIVDNDRRPDKPEVRVKVSRDNVQESQAAVFTFIRDAKNVSKPLELKVRVGGTAKPKHDFEAPMKRIVIPAGQDRVKVPVKIRDDSKVERDETVVVTLLKSKSYDISARAGGAQLTIIDNDHPKNDLPQWLTNLGDRIKQEGGIEGLLPWLNFDRDDDDRGHDDRDDDD